MRRPWFPERTCLKNKVRPDEAVHSFNPSTWEAVPGAAGQLAGSTVLTGSLWSLLSLFLTRSLGSGCVGAVTVKGGPDRRWRLL